MAFLTLTIRGTIWYVSFLYLLDHETYLMLTILQLYKSRCENTAQKQSANSAMHSENCESFGNSIFFIQRWRFLKKCPHQYHTDI